MQTEVRLKAPPISSSSGGAGGGGGKGGKKKTTKGSVAKKPITPSPSASAAAAALVLDMTYLDDIYRLGGIVLYFICVYLFILTKIMIDYSHMYCLSNGWFGWFITGRFCRTCV